MEEPSSSSRIFKLCSEFQSSSQGFNSSNVVVLCIAERETRLGSRHLASQVSPYAGIHVVHVWGRRTNLQHGYRVHASPLTFQKYCWYECSVRAICAYNCKRQVSQGPSSPEDSVHRMQPVNACSWPLEVSFNGSSTNRNSRLACIRESRDGT